MRADRIEQEERRKVAARGSASAACHRWSEVPASTNPARYSCGHRTGWRPLPRRNCDGFWRGGGSDGAYPSLSLAAILGQPRLQIKWLTVYRAAPEQTFFLPFVRKFLNITAPSLGPLS